MSRTTSLHPILTRYRTLPLCAATVALTLCGPAASQSGRAMPAGADAVQVEDVQRWLGMLAGPEFAGRGTGQDGYAKAAAYVADHFRALGLEARGENGSYFQHVPWTATKVSKATLTFRAGGTEFVVPSERLAGSVSGSTDAKGSVLLLHVKLPESQDGGGRGRMPEIAGLDAVDAAGKVVVVIADADRRAAAMARFAVMAGLQGKNTAAVLFATADDVQGGLSGRGGMGRRGGNPAAAAARQRPLDVSFGGADLQKMLVMGGIGGDKVAGLPLATQLPVDAHVEVAIETGDAPAMNVFAVLPGSDPKLKDEYVVIGSHLDHLGRRGDTIYPGADDDGSGTTGVLAVAQMFAKSAIKPRRSVLFVCFSGEESGLVGSGYFVDNCPIPLSSIAAELQMDMIGRDEEESRDGGRLVNVGETAEDNKNVVHLVGTQKLSSRLHELCMAKNETAGFDIEFDQEGLFTRSDHANFAYKGVPIAFFFTGIHKDYHQPSDTPDKINYPKLLRIARWVFDIGHELATADDRPTVDEQLWKEFKSSDRRGRMPAEPAAPLTPPAPRKPGG